MAPCRSAKVPSVVVGISRPGKAVIRDFVPFFACDLARLATDAYRRVGEEPNLDIFLHVIVPTLVRAVSSFADHAITICLRARDRRRFGLRRAAVLQDEHHRAVRIC